MKFADFDPKVSREYSGAALSGLVLRRTSAPTRKRNRFKVLALVESRPQSGQSGSCTRIL